MSPHRTTRSTQTYEPFFLEAPTGLLFLCGSVESPHGVYVPLGTAVREAIEHRWADNTSSDGGPS